MESVLIFVFGFMVGFTVAIFDIRRRLLKGGGVRDYDGQVRFLR